MKETNNEFLDELRKQSGIYRASRENGQLTVELRAGKKFIGIDCRGKEGPYVKNMLVFRDGAHTTEVMNMTEWCFCSSCRTKLVSAKMAPDDREILPAAKVHYDAYDAEVQKWLASRKT